MLLNLEQMKEITRGAVRVEENEGYFRFLRFTEAQTNAYREAGKNDFYKKTFATAGIRLAFRTDSKRLSFDYLRKSGGSSRPYAYFDVYQNGSMTSHFGVEGKEVTAGRAEITLVDGEKDVEVYLPWSAPVELSRVELDDGATLTGLRRKYNIICFGDSITHGYDAIYPSLSYACRVSRLLDADLIDKGIGGDIFFPPLVESADPVTPDIVTVAYGTNDWSSHPRDRVEENARLFYSRVSALYPTAKIFAITPICRLDGNKETKFGAPATEMDELIRSVCRELPNVTVLNGWTFTPAMKEFYSDKRLHPNDLGFGIYASNLYREIMKHL